MPQNATEGELSTNQEKALAALLAGHTATEAASIAGVHRSTVHRWLKEPEFLAEHNRQKAEIQAAVTGRLNALQLTAIRPFAPSERVVGVDGLEPPTPAL